MKSGTAIACGDGEAEKNCGGISAVGEAQVKNAEQSRLSSCWTRDGAGAKGVGAPAGADSLTQQPPASQSQPQQLSELALLRARCQAQMLRHFVEVSQAMPPEPGRRYLAAMQHLTLGFHEQIEQSMSKSADHEHGHH